MHRSGTSALTAALQETGIALGSRLVAAAPDNPGGYFEHADAVTINEALLTALGRGWEDVRPLPDHWMETTAALQAAREIEALVRRDFIALPIWALKDPRLCRLLPLWLRVLHKLDIRVRCLFLVRHPEEVAASLRVRDGFAEDYSSLLWLRYLVDAERDTRGVPRAFLEFGQLVAHPVASVLQAGTALNITWPVAPAQAGLERVLDSSQRHHHSNDDSEARGPRGTALRLYRSIVAAADGNLVAADFDGPSRHLAKWSDRLTPWLQGLGASLARERGVRSLALQRCGQIDLALDESTRLSLSRLHELQQLHLRITETDAALDEAKRLSLRRMDEAEALGSRLAEAESALAESERLSFRRLDELQEMDQRLRQSDAALEDAKRLSLQHLDQLQEMDQRLRQSDAALEDAKRLSLQHLDQLQEMDQRLRQSDDALEGATRISQQHLDELRAVDQRLRQSDDALEDATRMSLQHLDELRVVDQRLRQSDDALEDATRISMQHLDQLRALDQRLRQSDDSLENANQLALSRLEEVQAFDRRLLQVDQALANVTDLSLRRLAEVEALDAQLIQTAEALQEAKRVAHMQQGRLDALQARSIQSASELSEASRLHLESSLHVEQLQREILQQNDHLQAVVNSRSWRYTRLLRQISGLFGRHKGSAVS